MLNLKNVKKVYSYWGKHPFRYKIACLVTFLGKEQYLRRETVRKLNLKKGNTVLDIACGTGANFEYLYEAVGRNGKIIGFDYTQEMLDAARDRIYQQGWRSRNFELIQGDAAELNKYIKKNSIDGVISTLGISAIPRYKLALKKAVGVLKKGKRISILDAKLLEGSWSVFNPLVALIYRYTASWDPSKDIIGELEKLLGNIYIEKYNVGSIYIVSGQKIK